MSRIGQRDPLRDEDDEFEEEVYEEDDDYSDDDYEPADDEDAGQPVGDGAIHDDAKAMDIESLRNMFSESESESDFSMNDSDVGESANRMHIKTKKKRTGKSHQREEKLSDEVQELLEHAQEAFTSRDYKTAVALAEEAVKEDPKARRAFDLLAAIYEDLGEPHRVLIAKVAAAHLNKRNKDRWLEVAQLSSAQGQQEQAIAFLGLAHRADKSDYRIQMQRVGMLMGRDDFGSFRRALKYLKQLRAGFLDQMTPDERSEVFMDIAACLQKLGRQDEAIALLEELMRQNLEPDVYNEPEVGFNWQLLHNLTELYESEKQYRKAIRTIKTVARWILGRPSETWWDDVKDDSEFDERRRSNKRFQKSPWAGDDSRYELVIDIRVRLLLLRIKLNDFEADMLPHVNVLKQYPPESYGDLYLAVGAALQDVGQHGVALGLFEMIRNAYGEVSGQYQDCFAYEDTTNKNRKLQLKFFCTLQRATFDLATSRTLRKCTTTYWSANQAT